MPRKTHRIGFCYGTSVQPKPRMLWRALEEVSPIDFQRDDVDVKFEKCLRLHSEGLARSAWIPGCQLPLGH